MNVLMTVHRYWPSVGGTEAFVEGLAESLAARGHDVTVATSSEPGMPTVQERNDVTIRRFDLVRKGKFRVPHKDYRDLIRSGEHDVWVAHGQRVWSTDYAYDLMRKSEKAVVAMYHGFYQYHMNGFRPPEWAYYHGVLPWATRKAHMVVAETEGEKGELVRFGVNAERICVISSALDAAEFQQPLPGFRAKYGLDGKPLLLYVGGFYANKRVEDAVRVAARTGARLVVIGRDPDPTQANVGACVRLAKDLGADVRFLGKVPWEDVKSAYQEAELLLLPSKFEGYGLVLLEAMASGLPFVASRAGAAPELAALGAGVSVRTVDEMAESVTELLQDAEALATMAKCGRDAVQGFTWKHVAVAHEATYKVAMEECARRRA